MSAPKPSTLLLILALVAVVALFVVGVAVRGPEDRTMDKASLKERFLSGPKPVAAQDLEGDPCRHPLVAGQRCAFEVKGAWALARSLKVTTTDGVTVQIQPKGQGRAVPVELKRPGTSQRVDLQVGQKGARIEITCRAPVNPMAGCQVHVG
ncbi:MAG TPA: hypothetical protein VFA20_22410 [Myxococcaceae bacterium]|nr:hypothetical protein [Myxococcaceae bacterium]